MPKPYVIDRLITQLPGAPRDTAQERELIQVSTGPADAGKIPLLNDDGELDSSFGTGGGTPAITYTDTGILVQGGVLDGPNIDVSNDASHVRGISTGNYTYPEGTSPLQDWRLWVGPTPVGGQFVLQVRKKEWGNALPSSGDIISGLPAPTLNGDGATFTASGNINTWTGSPIAVGDMLMVVPTRNTAGVKWWALFIPVRRHF